MATVGTSGYGTLLQRATKVPSHMHTGVPGNNTGILWTAVTEGTGGDSITVHIVDPGGDGTLAVSVSGNDIHVTLAYATGAVRSTATEVIAAVTAHNEASALVIASHDGVSTGAGVVPAEGPTSLANGSNTETFVSVAEVGNITGPNMTLGTVEATHQTSTSGVKEYIATVLDTGEISFPLNFLPTAVTHDQIYGLIKDVKHKILRKFQLVMTDATTTTASFSAYVTAFGQAASIDGKLTANVSLRISGPVSFA